MTLYKIHLVMSEIVQPRTAGLQIKAAFGAHTSAVQSQIPTDNAMTPCLLRLLHSRAIPTPTSPTTAARMTPDHHHGREHDPRHLYDLRDVRRGHRRASLSQSRTSHDSALPATASGRPADLRRRSLDAPVAARRARRRAWRRRPAAGHACLALVTTFQIKISPDAILLIFRRRRI